MYLRRFLKITCIILICVTEEDNEQKNQHLALSICKYHILL